MKTITVQQMPNGFEIEMPSLGYWVKAGVGFFFGTALGGVCAYLLAVTILATLGLGWKLLNLPLALPTSQSAPRR